MGSDGEEYDDSGPPGTRYLSAEEQARGLPAGFTSPAADHIDGRLDLNKYLIKNPEATHFARVGGTP